MQPATVLLIYGNPKAGTPLMKKRPKLLPCNCRWGCINTEVELW